ncbi:MAG: type II toxin-antitoxin system VapC family toxin [Chloroflexia bacterium]|nr:type II toxin-antitoxin system VapC family toxin [Chloroflexia bacterium]
MTGPIYLLDTDIVSYSVKGRHRSIAERIALLDPADYAISVMTRAELLFGLHLVPPIHPAHLRVRKFLGEVQTLDWGQDAADTYALLRHQLQVKCTPMDHLDLMIAAHAISLAAVLVTNNTRHFQHLAPSLMIENWADAT